MRVSVITPVYNAAEFVTQAVESALAQPEVAEVLLVEDGSPDNALEVCQALADRYNMVRLLQHPNGENRGAGASRNLGMKNANFEYIAFLDADDLYLPGRFNVSSQVFRDNSICDGVYEATEIQLKNENALVNLLATGRNPDNLLISMKVNIDSRDLGKSLIIGKSGYFHLNGLVFKKSMISQIGFMNENLRLHQDTEWMIRCALVAKLYPGSLQKPVANVIIHEQNRFFSLRPLSEEYRNRMLFWLSLYHWSKSHADLSIQKLIIDRIIGYTKAHKYFRKFPRQFFPARLVRLTRLFRLLKYPEIIKDKIFIKK